MNVINYTILDPKGDVVNIILWNGDENTWSLKAAYGEGYTVRITTAEDQISV